MKDVGLYYCSACHYTARSRKPIEVCPKCEALYLETAAEVDDIPNSLSEPPPDEIPLMDLFKSGLAEIFLGRREGASDVVLQLITLAPVHVSFTKSEDRMYVHDLQDEYPTYVNGDLLTHSHCLRNSDTLIFGGLSYVFEEGCLKRVMLAGTRVNIDDLSIRIRSGRHERVLIDHFRQTFEPGESVVLRGESGCGKSTLLTFIASKGLSRAKPGGLSCKGKLSIEQDGSRDVNIVYVPQDPVLPSGLTVDEVFRLFARLYKLDNPDIEINYVLSALGLSKPAQRSNLLDRLSGGEKRRVHVGLELLRKPTLLLIDEPDSNLDILNRRRTLLHLVALKYSGVTIIATSHSSESERYFDRQITMDGAGVLT